MCLSSFMVTAGSTSRSARSGQSWRPRSSNAVVPTYSANLRGGGEFGRAWHDGGRLEHKQHVFDDFVAVARELARSGLSRPERTAILGRSNGGLLVGASITQHPEAFGAAVAEVGVLDMLRFHKFTIGWAWSSDFGDPDDPEQYRWLRVTHRSTTSAKALGIRRRCFSPGTTTTVSFRPTPSSSRPAYNAARRRRPDPAPGGDVRRPRRGQADGHADTRERRRAHIRRGGARRQPSTDDPGVR